MGGILFCLCACCCFGCVINKKIKNITDDEHNLDKVHAACDEKIRESDSELISISELNQSVVGDAADGTTIITASSSQSCLTSPSSAETQLISVGNPPPSRAQLHYLYSAESSTNHLSDTHEQKVGKCVPLMLTDSSQQTQSANTMKIKRSHDASMDTCIYHKETSGLCMEESKDAASSNLHIPGTDKYESSEFWEG